ncbi:MAG: hypothetical protein Q8M31_07030 [Beijerinckiaceae bacterium]|nr:hypothetical protein [Beijerinckiaceae bacterium]
MSDSNFRPGSTTQYGAGSASDLGPEHPRSSGMSHDPQHRLSDPGGKDQGYMDQASHMADDAWQTGRDYYEQGSRRVSEWAEDHPSQLWTAIAVASVFALWMAYRPVLSRVSRNSFDPARYRYRREPRPSGRAASMERGATSVDRQGRGI